MISVLYKDEVAKSNTEIVDGVTRHLKHLEAFYLGVTNEWLEAMSVVIGDKQVPCASGCFRAFNLFF